MNQNQKGLAPILIIGLVVAVLIAVGGFSYIKIKTNSQIVGGDKDEHGCIGSAGYTWCEAKNKCLRLWEEECVGGENKGKMTDDQAKEFFSATEIINNSLPEFIEFWTEAYCPNEGTNYDYVVPEGYSVFSCDKNLQGVGTHNGCPTCVMSLIKLKNNNFTYLNQPVKPNFLGNIGKTNNVSFDLTYNSSENEYGFYQDVKKDEKGDSFIFLYNDSQSYSDYSYNKYRYTIFSPEGSHSYGGAGLKINDLNSKYSISYIGLKINNPNLISSLTSEVVFSIRDDYRLNPSSPVSFEKNIISFLDQLLIPEKAYACGPGKLIDLIGKSDLQLEKIENDIYWYRLKTPIRLYNFPLGPCYDDFGKLLNSDEYTPNCYYCNYCKDNCDFYSIHNQEHYDCIAICEYLCFKWNTNVPISTSFNIVYNPNKEANGFLKIQVSNIILQDINGNYVESSFEENFSDYYRAYLGTP
ncbi:MAG: hypothetical protein WC303_01895 [Candidatus Paceibacterota bacterium]|jgi:hypothetical protein